LTGGVADLSVRETPDGVEVWIHVTPRARRPGVGGSRGDSLRIGVAAPPAEGRANLACARALADALEVRKDAVRLDPRSRGRRKRVEVTGDPVELARRLRSLAAGRPVG
jgi:uncharacterized protein YggU (UPF0235/DUF167 family)